MVAGSSTALINHLAFSRVRASTYLLEGAMTFGTEASNVLVENDAPSQGSFSVQVNLIRGINTATHKVRGSSTLYTNKLFSCNRGRL